MADEASEAAEPATVDIRNDITVESSLVFLTHPDIIKVIESVAARKSKAYRGKPKGILKAIRSGSDQDGSILWKPGDPQQVEGSETLDMSSYTLEFDEAIRIVEFYEAILRSGYQYSFLHFRRPGDPLGRDVRKIQNLENSADRAKAAAPEPAAPVARPEPAATPAPTTEEAQTPVEPPATPEEADAIVEELEKPVSYENTYGVKEINPTKGFTENVLDENMNVVKTAIQTDPSGGAFGDFYMITSTGFFKAYRARGKTAGDVVNYIKKFIASPDK